MNANRDDGNAEAYERCTCGTDELLPSHHADDCPYAAMVRRRVDEAKRLGRPNDG